MTREELELRLVVDIEIAAEVLGISSATYRREARAERLPLLKVSARRFVVPVQPLLAVIDGTAAREREGALDLGGLDEGINHTVRKLVPRAVGTRGERT